MVVTSRAKRTSMSMSLPRDCSTLIKMGKAAFEAGRKAEARYLFRAVLELDPAHSDALLWMAYLAGGGRPSLKFLARVLDVDPTSQRARAAIRWARSSPGAQGVALAPPPVRPSERDLYRPTVVFGLAILLLGLFGGLAIVAFVRGLPTGNWARTAANVVAAGTNPLLTAQMQLSPTSLVVPTATPSPTPLPVSTATFVPTASKPVPLLVPSSTKLPPATTTASPSPSSTATVPPTATLVEPSPTATTQPTLTPSVAPPVSPEPIPTTNVGENFRWIDVDLSDQRLVAYEGEKPVRDVAVSTGLPRTPTVTGRFKIYVKYKAATMSGDGYYLEGVPYVMYFYKGYGLHGTYWHTNFGYPMSHGCVNLPTPEAEWLFNWSSVGTLVVVHD